MPPIRLFNGWNERKSDHEPKKDPYKKYIFVCEGVNTEVWYFKYLIENKRELGIGSLIDISVLERTEEDKDNSNPVRLIEYAESAKIRDDFSIDVGIDKLVIVFDSDIYKNKPDDYSAIIDRIESCGNIAGVTYPNFELFLLLHVKDSVKNVIKKHEVELIENRKVRKKRYSYMLLRDATGINSKQNEKIGELAKDIEIAIKQEKMINQDIYNAIGKLTSNIGKIIEHIIYESVV